MDEQKNNEVQEKKEEKKSWWNREIRLTVKDILLGLAAPVCALIGVTYTADKRLEEKKLDLEVAKINAEAAVHTEAVRQAGRMEQLKLICKCQEDGELPDSYSLKLLNENNK